MSSYVLHSIEGNRQRLDGGSMYGNVPRAMWAPWSPPDEENRIELACRAFLIEDQARGLRILLEAGIGVFFHPKKLARFGVVEPGEPRGLEGVGEGGLPRVVGGVVVGGANGRSSAQGKPREGTNGRRSIAGVRMARLSGAEALPGAAAPGGSGRLAWPAAVGEPRRTDLARRRSTLEVDGGIGDTRCSGPELRGAPAAGAAGGSTRSTTTGASGAAGSGTAGSERTSSSASSAPRR